MNIFAMSVATRKSMGARTCAPVLILVIVFTFVIGLSLSGCGAHKVPQHQQHESVIFSGCVITQAIDGKNSCACMNPVVETVLDAGTGKTHKVAYCESQALPQTKSQGEN